MNRIFVLLSVVLLLACSGQKQDSQNVAKDSSSANQTTTESTVVVKKDSTVPVAIERHELPEDCIFTGNFKEAWRWSDKYGNNILILSIGEKSWKAEEIEETASTKELYARHYIGKGSKSELLWQLFDAEKDCIFDLTAEFLFSPQFTDLDNDGIKESTLVYKLACRSDVSPARMKIVMHEGENKYALRGVMYIPMIQQGDPDTTDYSNWQPDLSKLKLEKDDYAGYWGRYENAKDFSAAPPAFIEYAKQLWLDNFVEKF